MSVEDKARTAGGIAAVLRPAQFAIVVAVAVAAGALLRFWGLGTRALWLDEAYSEFFSGRSWSELWRVVPTYEVHPPAYYSILKLWRAVAGSDPAALRGLSAAAGLGTIPVIAASAATLHRLRPVANPMLMVAGAAGLAALSPRLLYLAQDARPYALLTLAYAVAVYGWLRLALAFRSGGAGGWPDWLLLAGGTTAALWLHSLGLLYGAALFGALVLIAIPEATPARWRRLGLTVAAVSLLYAPCMLLMAGRVGDWGTGWLRWNPRAFAGDFIQLYGLHRLDEKITPLAAFIAFPILLYIAIRGMLRDGKRAHAAGFALLLLGPPLAAAAISQAGIPVFLPRTLVAVLVPAYLLIAYGVARLPRRLAFATAGLVALLLLVNSAQIIRRPPQERWDAVAASIAAQAKPGDVIWVYPNDVALPLAHQLAGHTIGPVPAPYPAPAYPGGTRPNGSPAVIALNPSEAGIWAAANAPAPGATVWLVRGGAWLFDPEDDVLSALASGREVTRAGKWDYIDLHAFRPVQPR